jgi:hypothetical protein
MHPHPSRRTTILSTSMRRAATATLAIGAAICAAGTGCETIGSDLRAFGESFAPPSPSQAAAWAVDTTDSENMRRGISLLSNSVFGGTEAYVKLYRFYVQEERDPLVQAASIEALGRHGTPDDALIISDRLDSSFFQVRLAAANALQRLHNPRVAERMWRRLISEQEESDVRVELAIGLGQYPRDDVFQALATALDQSELAVNLASLDSLRLLTTQDYGMNRRQWLSWYAATPANARFAADRNYLYPTYQRNLGFWDYLVFWDIPKFESPGVPAGLASRGARSTYSDGADAPAPFGNVGAGVK